MGACALGNAPPVKESTNLYDWLLCRLSWTALHRAVGKMECPSNVSQAALHHTLCKYKLCKH